MAIVNLKSIYAKVRRLTGSNILQLPDNANPSNSESVGAADYLNSFYNYDLPAQFRSLKLKDKYTFNTTQGIDTYAFNSEQYTTIDMPCYCMKREIALFTDPWPFYGANFNWQRQTNFAFGNGGPGPYNGFTNATPLLRSYNNNPYSGSVPTPVYTPGNPNYGTPNVPGVSQGAPAYAAQRVQNILITANTATGTCNVTDDGNGYLIGDVSTTQPQGTIDYQTGIISGIYFYQNGNPVNIPMGNAIQIQYNPVKETIPLSILFFQNQLTLRPVPDQGYTIELTCYRQPTQALAQTPSGVGTPELSEFWETIAFGMAKKIFQDRLDMDGVQLMDKFLQEAYQLNYTRTHAQIGSARVPSIYQDQLQGGYSSGIGGFNSGSM